MSRTDKIFFYLLLLVPFVSSVLSTIHIIDFVRLGNIIGMSFAVAITFEVSSVISFAATGGSVLKHVNKGWLYFIFCMLFILQVIGNIYSGFSYMNYMLISDPTWLNNVIEMTMGYFTNTEVKIILATCIGLPLPVISLIMLKFAIDKASVAAFMSGGKDDVKKDETGDIFGEPVKEEVRDVIDDVKQIVEPVSVNTVDDVQPVVDDVQPVVDDVQPVVDDVQPVVDDVQPVVDDVQPVVDDVQPSVDYIAHGVQHIESKTSQASKPKKRGPSLPII